MAETTNPGTLSKWLALVPVLALEVGSALAVVLAGGTPIEQRHPQAVPRAGRSAVAADFTAEGAATAQTANAAQRASPITLKAALLEHLRARGGSLRTGQRRLAKTLGTSTTELHRTLHALSAAGVIALNTAPSGTELRLA